jgi:effector-binding domain-containing protein
MNPIVLDCPAQRTAVIRLTVPRSEIQLVMGPGIREVYAVLQAQGLAPAGPWLSHHLRMDPELFDLEIAVPVDADVAPQGRVQPGLLPARRVARTEYRGPYEGLGVAWGEFRAWIAKQGLVAAPDLWETYRTGPADSPHADDWVTEFNQPLVSVVA